MNYKEIFHFYIVRAAKYKWYFFLMLLGTVILGVYPFLNNYALKLIIDTLESAQVTAREYLTPILIFIITMLSKESAYILFRFAQLKAYPKIYRTIMVDIYDIVQHKQYSFFQKNQCGSITGKLVDTVEIYDFIIEEASDVLRQILIISINATILLNINWQMGAFVLVMIVIALIVNYFLAKKLTNAVTEKENAFYRVVGNISDCFINIFSILSFFSLNKEKHRLNDHISTDFLIKQKISYKYQLALSASISFFYSIISIASLFYAIQLKISGQISLGDVAFIFGLAMFLSEGMLECTFSMQYLLFEVGRIKSVFEIIDKKDCVQDGDKILKITNPSVEFHDVSFKYPEDGGKSILTNFNLKIKAGEHIGVIGESGVGKSSFISLILGLFKNNDGQILISGTDIKDVSLKSLRDNIGIIPQDTLLFNRSIMENLKYGKECIDEEVIEICKQVGLHDIIMQMPQQYDTYVGERGSKLSGGQRQRVSIVRAILKKAPILLLDEATSALDSQTEYEIHNLINDIFKGVTMIVIAHRLTTIKNMDRIVMLKDGQIAEEGTHEELLSKDSLYKKLWSI